jgi:hypothetical protein
MLATLGGSGSITDIFLAAVLSWLGMLAAGYAVQATPSASFRGGQAPGRAGAGPPRCPGFGGLAATWWWSPEARRSSWPLAGWWPGWPTGCAPAIWAASCQDPWRRAGAAPGSLGDGRGRGGTVRAAAADGGRCYLGRPGGGAVRQHVRGAAQAQPVATRPLAVRPPAEAASGCVHGHAWLLAIAAVLAAAGLAGFRRRDLASTA